MGILQPPPLPSKLQFWDAEKKSRFHILIHSYQFRVASKEEEKVDVIVKLNSVRFSSLLHGGFKISGELRCRREEHSSAKPCRHLKTKPKHTFFPEAGQAASGSHPLLNNCPLMF